MNEIIFRFLNNLAGQSPLGDAVIIFLAEYLGWALIALLAVYFFRRRYRAGWPEQALALLATTGVSWLLAQAIKYFYARPRPFAALSDVHQLISETSNAMPSGHAASFFALALTLYLYDRRWGNIYLVGAVVIGTARVAAGIHWPIDILAGVALAGIVTLVFNGWFGFSRRQNFRD